MATQIRSATIDDVRYILIIDPEYQNKSYGAKLTVFALYKNGANISIR